MVGWLVVVGIVCERCFEHQACLALRPMRTELGGAAPTLLTEPITEHAVTALPPSCGKATTLCTVRTKAIVPLVLVVVVVVLQFNSIILCQQQQ